jgi:misacylated tRNA(Ala) deacylase
VAPLDHGPAKIKFLQKFSSKIIGLATSLNLRSKPQFGRPRALFPGNFRQYSRLPLVNADHETVFSSKRMARLFCHDHPDTLVVETEIVDAKPGRVRLAQSPFYPGGGGQLADRGMLRWSGGETAIVGFESVEGRLWNLLADPAEPSGTVQAAVDPAFRQMMRELHTDTHILNALVFQSFNGALVTGVQMNEDGTARMDFDLPEADNERLRALEAPINDMIRQNLIVRDDYIPADEAYDQPGLIRSKSVAPPPTPDGKIRIVEIVGLDRQACGGTHLGATGASRGLRILKIENKGRHNRRLRIALEGASS